MQKRAIFLDRDGTLIIDRHYPADPDEVTFIPGVPEILRKLQEHFLLIVVSNQSGVAKGLISLSEFQAVHNQFVMMLNQEGVRLSGIAYCRHAPEEECDCRKPKPTMLLEEAAKLHVDLASSYMIGDKKSDLKAGLTAGCTSILLTDDDKNSSVSGDRKNGYRAQNLIHAGEWILSRL